MAAVVDSTGLRIQMNGFITIDKYLLGTHFVPDAVLGMQQGIKLSGTFKV